LAGQCDAAAIVPNVATSLNRTDAPRSSFAAAAAQARRMKRSMEALIHHFKLYTGGFPYPKAVRNDLDCLRLKPCNMEIDHGP
jgi:hypothetical protein